MGIISRILGIGELATANADNRAPERRSTLSSWDLMRGIGFETESGVAVSPHLAENLSAVYAAVQCISESIAALPLYCYRRAGDGVKFSDPNHPVARLFQKAPNDIQTGPELVEQLIAFCLLRGNAYCQIIRDNRGAPVELYPLHPDCVCVLRLPGTRKIVYDYSDPITGGTRRLLPEEVFHLRDRTDDGFVGKSRLARARESIGTAIAIERFAANTFKNGARLSGVLEHPAGIGDQALLNIKQSFVQNFSGAERANSVLVLEEGMKWQSISVPPEDAELLMSRRFGTESIARIFRVPLPLLADISNGSYSNIVELNRMFATHTLTPWIVRLEKTIERDLLSEDGRRTHLVEIDQDDLLRGDMLQRWQSYRIMREIGGASANEISGWEKINRRTDPGGDEFLRPMNMQPEQTGMPKQ
jgi:HK97 family phage portal protein